MPFPIKSITQLHRLLEIEKPKHPLVSVIDFSTIKCFEKDLETVTYHFYCIALKKNFEGMMKYGQQYVDFEEGVMTFFSPHQVVTTEIVDDLQLEGYWLVIHPDFLKGTAFDHKIKNYPFFSYEVYEALFLSEDEEQSIKDLLLQIRKETQVNIDHFSQEIILSQIELMLNYVSRYYSRQFITRQSSNRDILMKFEKILTETYHQENDFTKITVEEIAAQLHLSPNYLSDLLRSISGASTQEHIQRFKLEKAKELLTSTELSVSEIAYCLGYERPQSFNKIFKKYTELSPLEYKKSFNN